MLRIPACRLVTGASLILAFFTTMSAGRQQGQLPTPSFHAQTTYVLIDASVTNRQGEFVSGLTVEDFQIFEDGQVRPVERVALIDLHEASALDATTQPARTPASEPKGRPTGRAPLTPAIYILALDDLHIPMERSLAARAVAENFLQTVPLPGDLVGLVITSTGEVTEPTANVAEIAKALKQVIGKKLPSALTTQALEGDPRIALRVDQGRMALRSLASAVQRAGRAGERRKALVVVSEGVDPGNWNDIAPVMRELVGAANRANVSVYALNPRGGAVDTATSNALTSELIAEQQWSHERLSQLAVDTDGAAFHSAPDFSAAYRRIREDSRTYYLVAFRPSQARVGEHRIEVRVNRPGLRVRSRSRYDDRVALTADVGQRPAPLPPDPAQPASAPAAPSTARSEVKPAPVPSTTLSNAVPAVADTATAAIGDVQQLVARAGQALAAYAEQLSFVICVEKYAQYMGDQSFSRAYGRSLVSEFALVRVKDDWLGFRDVYEVDGKPVADRQDRLRKLFLEGGDSAMSQARRINDESARHNLGAMQRNFNVPTMALFFLQPTNASRFRFRKEGEETTEGTPVWKIRFEETRKPTIIRTSSGRDMPVKGTFWIEPLHGLVYKTHMEIASEATIGAGDWKDRVADPTADGVVRRVRSSASITVRYTQNTLLNLLMPSEMSETYEGPSVNRFTGKEEVSRINCRATYSEFKRFETGGRVLAPK